MGGPQVARLQVDRVQVCAARMARHTWHTGTQHTARHSTLRAADDAQHHGTAWCTYCACRGVAYDLGPYMARHPGGSWLINLALGRDCTALFESYHLRPDVAGERAVGCLRRAVGCLRRAHSLARSLTVCARPPPAVSHLRRLPVLQGFPIDAVPRSPYPNDSEVRRSQ